MLTVIIRLHFRFGLYSISSISCKTPIALVLFSPWQKLKSWTLSSSLLHKEMRARCMSLSRNYSGKKQGFEKFIKKDVIVGFGGVDLVRQAARNESFQMAHSRMFLFNTSRAVRVLDAKT